MTETGWILVEDELPKGDTNPITSDYYTYEVSVCFEGINGEPVYDIRHYKFGAGHWWYGPQNMDQYVIAWRQHLPPVKRSDRKEKMQ